GSQLQAAFPQGTLGYSSAVANQGPFTALTDLTNLSVSVTVVGSGRRIRVTGFAAFSSTVAADVVQFYIRDTGTSLQIINWGVPTASTGFANTISVVLTPSSGS